MRSRRVVFTVRGLMIGVALLGLDLALLARGMTMVPRQGMSIGMSGASYENSSDGSIVVRPDGPPGTPPAFAPYQLRPPSPRYLAWRWGPAVVGAVVTAALGLWAVRPIRRDPKDDADARGDRTQVRLVHIAGWLLLWAAWITLSRNNHPNLELNAVASALLVATFAAAAYANHLALIPRLWRRRRFVAYGVALALVMGVLALACTAAIHIVYDLLWGPDPARFGFLTNLGMESALVAFHVAAIAAGVAVARRFRSRASAYPE